MALNVYTHPGRRDHLVRASSQYAKVAGLMASQGMYKN